MNNKCFSKIARMAFHLVLVFIIGFISLQESSSQDARFITGDCCSGKTLGSLFHSQPNSSAPLQMDVNVNSKEISLRTSGNVI